MMRAFPLALFLGGCAVGPPHLPEPLRADVHLHSVGCGDLPRGEIVRLLLDAGMQAGSDLVMTPARGEPMGRAPESTDVTLAVGLEVSRGPGHILAHPSAMPESHVRGASAVGVAEELAGMGAPIWIAHGQQRRPMAPILLARGEAAGITFDDGHEYGRGEDPTGAWWAVAVQAWQVGARAGVAGGSDYPCMPQPVGAVATLYRGQWPDALASRETGVARAGAGWLWLTVAGASQGQTARVERGAVVTIEVDGEGGGAVEVWAGGRRVGSARVLGGYHFEASFTAERSTWIAARQPGAFTSPVWIEVDGLPYERDADAVQALRDELIAWRSEVAAEVAPEIDRALGAL